MRAARSLLTWWVALLLSAGFFYGCGDDLVEDAETSSESHALHNTDNPTTSGHTFDTNLNPDGVTRTSVLDNTAPSLLMPGDHDGLTMPFACPGDDPSAMVTEDDTCGRIITPLELDSSASPNPTRDPTTPGPMLPSDDIHPEFCESAHAFVCTTGDCIDLDHACDGMADCIDGSDEADCSIATPVDDNRLNAPPNTTDTITRDGYRSDGPAPLPTPTPEYF